MRVLNFKIEGQKITKVGNFSNIVANSSGYLSIKLSFDSEWDGLFIVAEFYKQKNNEPTTCLLVKNGVCDVPDEVTKGDLWGVKNRWRKRRKTNSYKQNICTTGGVMHGYYG